MGHKDHLDDHQWLASISSDDLSIDQTRQVIKRGAQIAKSLDSAQARALLQRVTIKPDAITITINQQELVQQLGTDPDALNQEPICITQAASILRQGRSSKLVVGSVLVDDPCINQALVDQLKLANRWWQAMVESKASSITDLAARERVDPSEISRTITLAFLAPDIVRAILNGTQPPSLTLNALRRARPLTADWEDQRQMLLAE